MRWKTACSVRYRSNRSLSDSRIERLALAAHERRVLYANVGRFAWQLQPFDRRRRTGCPDWPGRLPSAAATPGSFETSKCRLPIQNVNSPSKSYAGFRTRGFAQLWAGGCVRDFLMGRVPQDYDVATNARPETVRELFGRRRTLAVGASFGVIVVVGSKESGNVEVATFRTEGPYVDGRRPEHVVFSTVQEDAQRRDFTINGMFYDPIAEKVYDYVGGEQDLAAGIVRAIGNPADRLSEDKLRLLRAVRFAATLEFELDPATADSIRAQARDIAQSWRGADHAGAAGRCSSTRTAGGRWNWRGSLDFSRRSSPSWRLCLAPVGPMTRAPSGRAPSGDCNC